MIKVSIIVPVYNEARFLQDCMSSIRQQSLQDIEIVCVNDASTDDSLAILTKNAAQDSRITIYNQPSNQGVSAARNRGIREARGEFVCFMDPDDFYPDDDILETLYQEAVRHHVMIAGGCFSDQNGDQVVTTYPKDLAGYVFPESRMMDYRDYQFDYGYHRFIYNRKFLLTNHLFFPPYKRCQDPPFFVRAMITAGHFYAIAKITYRYRVGHQQPPEAWPDDKFYDMLKGYMDNLNLSREYHLEKLHRLTVGRLENSYVFQPAVYKMRQGDYKTLQMFAEVNTCIDPVLLKEAGADIRDDYFLINELKEVINQYQDMRNRYEKEKFDKNSMEHSISFRSGRVLTWLPRIIRDNVKRLAR